MFTPVVNKVQFLAAVGLKISVFRSLVARGHSPSQKPSVASSHTGLPHVELSLFKASKGERETGAMV